MSVHCKGGNRDSTSISASAVAIARTEFTRDHNEKLRCAVAFLTILEP